MKICAHTSRNRQRDPQAGAAERRRTGDNAAVVEHDDLLHQREAEAGAAALGREERLEHALAGGWLDPGPLSSTVIVDTPRSASTSDSITTIGATDADCRPRPRCAAGC